MQGLELPRESRAKEIGAVLGALMDRLEHDKKVVKVCTQATPPAAEAAAQRAQTMQSFTLLSARPAACPPALHPLLLLNKH